MIGYRIEVADDDVEMGWSMFETIKEKWLTFVRSQDEVQQKIDEKFPYQYTDMPGVTLTFTNPRVWLLDEKDLVELFFDIHIKAVLIGEYHGHVGLRGQMIYCKEGRRIRLDTPEIIQLDIPALNEKWALTARQILNVIVNNHLQDLFCYPIPSGIVYSRIASLSIENRQLKIRFA